MSNFSKKTKSSLKSGKLLFLLFPFLFLSVCDMPMGMGPPIDLEPPVLRLTEIVLSDGTSLDIREEGNKLIIGPVILEGAGAVLKGEAWDNVLVERILVEEVDRGNILASWNNAQIGARNIDGWQSWSIVLDGLEKGERVIQVTAFDRPGNIGPESVQQLTLLLDTDPPFVNDVVIERHPGIQVPLMSRARLEEMDHKLFEYIDFFQNESFIIRANISHEYSLSNVTLNLINEDGENVFSQGLAGSGGLYTPFWEINAGLLNNYTTGKHYFNVIITATAQAGHSGQNDMSNIMFSLCWFPESDIPQIQVQTDDNGELYVENNEIIPVRVFDDDNLGEVYTGIISRADWNVITGVSDADKLQWLKQNRETFEVNGDFPFRDNKLNSVVRTTVIPVNVPRLNQGEYRLVILARDVKPAAPGVWAAELIPVHVIEQGIPVITVSDPSENTSPMLTDGESFTITGSVINIAPVEFIKIAWVPQGAGLTAQEQMSKGEEALKTGILTDGIKVWDIPIGAYEHRLIGSRTFREQKFNFDFNIFEDFIYNDTPENDIKNLILYTSYRGADVFRSLRFMPHDMPPVIEIISPENWATFGSGAVDFRISAVSPQGVSIDTVELFNVNGNAQIPLVKTNDEWTATESFGVIGSYHFVITAADRWGNVQSEDLYINIATLPALQTITTMHNVYSEFSGRDIVRVQAVFERVISSVTGTPRIALGGFTDDEPRYAIFNGVSGSATLVFVYEVQPNDTTGTSTLTATAFDLNGASMSADIPPALGDIADAFNARNLKIDAVAPVITSVEFIGRESDSDFYPWLRAGEELTIKVTTSKPVRVMGNPKLILPFGAPFRQADFITMEDDDTVMVFIYRVQNLDLNTDVVRLNVSGCISPSDLLVITDTAGALGNLLSLTGTPNQTGTARIDAVRPVTPIMNNNTQSPSSWSFTIELDNIETWPETTVEYTTNNWVTWTSISRDALPYPFDVTAQGTHSVSARQVDRAGNASDPTTPVNFTLGGTTELIRIMCDTPNGAYTVGSSLNFRLIFSGLVYVEGTSATITIAGDSGAQVIPITARAKTNADFSLYATWDITADIVMDPVTVTGINLTGVTRGLDDSLFTDDADYNAKMAALITGGSNGFLRPDLKVLSRNPVITGGSPVANNVITPSGGRSTITLQFSHPVWPENGIITVRPTGVDGTTTNGAWLIPPVLTNDEFSRINNALSPTDRAALINNTAPSFYIRTTHGLRVIGNNYVPDTDTKFVLNFTSGVDNAVIRPILDRAGFMQQDIEAVQVSGAGTNTIDVHLEQLPAGRQWKVEIAAGAFRDEAGNTFAGWGEANSPYWFWSQQTATPVIRVERVSNNRAHAGVTHADATFQRNVRARIDTVTPGASISYRIWNRDGDDTISNTETDINVLRGIGRGVARITTGAMPNQGDTDPYRANANDGLQNSNIEDATITELLAISVPSTSNYTIGDFLTIGDNDLYTARKDYIAAIAVHDILDASERGYEGAFKTVVVYRDVGPQVHDNGWLKIEATNTRNGAVTIAGFPMSYNAMDGTGSRFFYRNGGANTSDWIFITWEIVSEFWQVSPFSWQDTPPGVLHRDGTNSWDTFDANWYVHNFRKYGNWGMQRGNR
jgi:hypothetical protein